MAEREENSSLFAIFILTIMALFTVPFTILSLCRIYTKKKKDIHCQCSQCLHCGKFHKSFLKQLSSFLTFGNMTLMLLWVIMAVLVQYIKHISGEIQSFEPFSILGLEPGSTDSAIKKAYRRLSIQYHPDKNPDPAAHKYFVEFISKAYQALTDPISRENYEKYGHPDGRQGFQIGIALPAFLVSFDGGSDGVLLLSIVGICILLPLIAAVIYLSMSSKYTGNSVMHETLSAYYHFMKPSLAPSKIIDVFIKAAEFMEIPVRRSDDEPLHKLYTAVRSELNIDLKNVKSGQEKFWKQHPALVKLELLFQAYLTRESATLYPALQNDLKLMLERAPRLLEELAKIAVMPRNPHGYGWLRPTVGVLELSQCIIQAVPLSARKPIAGAAEGIAPFLQLPHFTETTAKQITRKKIRSFQGLRDLNAEERKEMLAEIVGFSAAESQDVELTLAMLPSVSVDVTCETDGEKGIQEGDIVTAYVWITLRRSNGLIAGLPHCPRFPFRKEESFWVLLADEEANEVWMSQKISFMDEAAALAAASREIQERKESLGASDGEISAAVRDAAEKVKRGSRLAFSKFRAPGKGSYSLSAYCLCDSWIGCDIKGSVKLRVLKRSRDADEGIQQREEEDEEDDEDEQEDHDESEYSSEQDEEGDESDEVKPSNGI